MEETTYPVVSGGDGPVWNDDWAARLQLTIPDHGKERAPAEMVRQRIGDYEAFVEYVSTVWAQSESFLERLDPDTLGDLIVPRPFLEVVANNYSARVAGADGITRADRAERRPATSARQADAPAPPLGAERLTGCGTTRPTRSAAVAA